MFIINIIPGNGLGYGILEGGAEDEGSGSEAKGIWSTKDLGLYPSLGFISSMTLPRFFLFLSRLMILIVPELKEYRGENFHF